ncbi:SEC62 [Candida oxycetoniae]|uniref:Translocation protein SEC62 n=1 Tax=Candida oxycetoniae TaxID=497107 RepID=A0AAI9SVL0_9ASCO|nr:SEC62 [Candida oxycetoniae]KAI3403898.1 SEC62 [Candida oxycetoniae]
MSAGVPPPNGQFHVKTTAQRSPVAINIANYLYKNPILKQRTGLLDNATDLEFFRFKRFERALLSDDYKAKQQNPKSGLIPIPDVQEVQKVFVMLIQNQLVLPVEKLHYAQIKAVKGWKPNKEKPTLKRADKAVIDPNSYFGWLYSKPNPYIMLYSILAIVGVFTIILFPLWPNFMRRGVWYLSMGALGLIGLFFAIAIVRLIIYIFSLLAFPQPFWLFPNLFEDCGVIESFKPLYAWEESKKQKKSKKGKKGKSSEAVKDSVVEKGKEKKKEAQEETNSESEKIEPIVIKQDKKASGVEPSSNGTTTKRKVTIEEIAE